MAGTARQFEERGRSERAAAVAAAAMAQLDRSGSGDYDEGEYMARAGDRGRGQNASQLEAFDTYDDTDRYDVERFDERPARGVQYPHVPDYANGPPTSSSATPRGAASLATRAPAETQRRGRPANNGNGNGADDPYSGYPTAARLLGITPSPRVESVDDDAPEPGKWRRSGRMQSWLEDAEVGTARSRVGVMGVPDEVEDDADLEAGVIATRPSQARRASAPAASRQTPRNNARPALPWERHPGAEPVAGVRREPELRRVAGGSRLPLAIGAGLLVIAALALFMLPGLAAPRDRSAARERATNVPAAAATSTPNATPEPTEEAPAVATPRVYRVAGGDSLSRIASKFGITVQDLLDANPQITNPKRIHIGDRITIPTAEPNP